MGIVDGRKFGLKMYIKTHSIPGSHNFLIENKRVKLNALIVMDHLLFKIIICHPLPIDAAGENLSARGRHRLRRRRVVVLASK